MFNENSNLDKSSEAQDIVDAPKSLPYSLLDKYFKSRKSREGSKKEDPRKISSDIPPMSANMDFSTITLKSKDYELEESEKQPVQESTPLEDSKTVPEPEIKDEKNEVDESLEGYDEETKHFFEELKKRYEVEKKHIHEHIESDSVLDKLKEFHKSKLSGDAFFLTENDIDKTIYAKLAELKELEDDWLKKFNYLEKVKAELLEKELEIESKIELFKKTFRKAERFRLMNTEVDEESAFKLEDGQVLKSIKDLTKALRYMDDNIFSHHVNSEKNDFANWIKLVFFEEELADALLKEKTKEGMFDKLLEY